MSSTPQEETLDLQNLSLFLYIFITLIKFENISSNTRIRKEMLEYLVNHCISVNETRNRN